MRYLTSIALLFVLPVAVFADIVRQGSLQARSDGSNVIVTWITDEEPSIERFEIERRIGTTGTFGYIASVQPKGPSLYEFIDYSSFRVTSTLYQYRIKVVFTDNTAPVYVGPVTVTHSVSGVKRTWGSIKAMFR